MPNVVAYPASMSKDRYATVIGAGLSGSEAAWQIAKSGIRVKLYEMRPGTATNAHRSAKCAELVCSNSLKSKAITNAAGLLKEELRLLGSLIIEAAIHTEVPAGQALAVDRERFSEYIHERITKHKLIDFTSQEVAEIRAATPDSPVVVATGPLTSKSLARNIESLTGHGNLAFYDAISPIVTYESLDHDIIFRQSRYDKGGDDYLNIPLSKDEYLRFVTGIAEREKYAGNAAVENERLDNIRPFEGCMPIEDIVQRGVDTLRYGPLKPVGLNDPRTGRRPYAVIQLRQDNTEGTLWSLVGMQTRLKQAEQLRIFRELPGMTNAEFVRLGTVHRNTFINSPQCLNSTLEARFQSGLFFAGQITGTEGYVESTAGGMLAGLNCARFMHGSPLLAMPDSTAMGALFSYITDPQRKDFQPMNISFGIMPSYLARSERKKGVKKTPKAERAEAVAKAALKQIEEILNFPSALPTEAFSATI